jgi:hypothetical protein
MRSRQASAVNFGSDTGIPDQDHQRRRATPLIGQYPLAERPVQAIADEQSGIFKNNN